jgi:hypothetical protein
MSNGFGLSFHNLYISFESQRIKGRDVESYRIISISKIATSHLKLPGIKPINDLVINRLYFNDAILYR